MRRVNKLVSMKIMLKLYAIGVEASMVILYFFRAGYMAMSVWQDYVTSPREYDGFPTRRNLILEWEALRIMVAEPQHQW